MHTPTRAHIITAEELLTLLKAIPPQTQVWLSVGEEGNEAQPVVSADYGFIVPGREVFMMLWSDDKQGYQFSLSEPYMHTDTHLGLGYFEEFDEKGG